MLVAHISQNDSRSVKDWPFTEPDPFFVGMPRGTFLFIYSSTTPWRVAEADFSSWMTAFFLLEMR